MFVLSLAAFDPPAAAQSDPRCAVHLSDCHVDTRLEMAGIADTRQARIFLDRLKAAARTGDRNGLAALVEYPLTIRDGDHVKTFRSAAAVVQAFDTIFTRGVLNAIAAADYDSLFVNASGAMIGDGEIWFDGWNGEVLIKAVNPGAAGVSSGVSGGMERIFRTQEALNSLGYDAGVSDGRMGPRTRKALAAFQRAQGLPVTSEIDAETIAALAGAREQGSAPRAAASETISILGADFPVALDDGRLADIPAEWEDVKPYIPAWLLAPPATPLDNAARLRLVSDIEASTAARMDAAIGDIADRIIELHQSGNDSNRSVIVDTLIDECLVHDASNESIPLSTQALCQERLALSFVTAILTVATKATESPSPSVAPAATPEPLSLQKPEAGSLPSFKDCEVCPEMVELPAGSYWMGATDEDKAFPHTEYTIPSELPLHQVTLDYSFAIGRFTITVAEFAAFVEETGTAVGGECLLRIPDKGPNKGKFIGKISANADEFQRGQYGAVLVEYADFRTPGTTVAEDQPATCISRNEAKAYLAWLSEKSGRAYRFPTEAEWEYATRAGESRPYYFGGGNGDQDKVCAYGNFADRDSVYAAGVVAKCAEQDSREYTYPVGSFKPNNWGLYDMIGNVFEYVEDCYFPNYEGAPTDGSPWMHSTAHADHSTDAPGACRVWGLRGYFFDSIDTTMRSATRCGVYDDEDDRGNAIGIRVAVSMSGESWDRR